MDDDQRKMLAASKLVYFAQSRLLSYLGSPFQRSVSLDPAVNPMPYKVPTGFDTRPRGFFLPICFAVDRSIMPIVVQTGGGCTLHINAE